MNLDTTSKVLQVLLGEGIATRQCQITTSYADNSATGFSFLNSNLLTNGTTPVTVVASPAASVQRQVKEVRVFNSDTIPHTVTLYLFDGTNSWVIGPGVQTIAPNGSFVYTPESGAQGPPGPAGPTGPAGATGPSGGSVVGALGVVVNSGTAEINNVVTLNGTAGGTLTIAPGTGTSDVIVNMPSSGGTVTLTTGTLFARERVLIDIVNGATLGSVVLNAGTVGSSHGFIFSSTVPSYAPSAINTTDRIMNIAVNTSILAVQAINLGAVA